MSQKKAKKLRKGQTENLVEKTIAEPVKGIRQILKENWKFLLILCVSVFVLYFNSLNGEFVSDDYATISQNDQIKNFSYGVQGWLGGIINWFLAITFDVKSPIPFHVFSLMTYIAVILTVFVFVFVLFDYKTAILTTILFSVLPLHVEAVSWIAGRPYLFNALFILLALVVGILYSKTESKKYLIYFLFLLIMAFFAEHTRFAVLPLLIILYWFSFENKLKFGKKINFKKLFLMMLCLFALMVVIMWPSLMSRINNVNSGYNGYGGIFYDPFFQYPTAIAKYLQLIFIPTDLTLYHTMYILPTWLNWLIFLFYLSAVVYFWFKDKKLFFALAFIFVAASLSMLPVKISWLVAERYVFLGSLGFCLFLVLFFQKFSKKWKIPLIIIFVFIIATYSVRVFLRNIDWQTNHNLWVNTCQVSPNSHNAWNNIGDDYDKLVQYENAIKGFGQSFAIKPNYADAYHNQANIFYKIGRLDLARKGYDTALSYNPSLVQTYQTLVQLDVMEKNKTELVKHLNILINSNPNNLQMRYLAAVAFAKVEMFDEAKKIADEMYKYYPNIKEIKDLYDSLNSIKIGESVTLVN